MDAHPIPQNVTSFQFKLVGDMTLKQFGYLAIGCAIAYVLFIFFAKDFPLFAYPLAALSALLGISFAFLPIQSRPLDHWTKAFFKAVYSPTKRIWGKNGKTYKENPLFASRLVMYMSGTVQKNNSEILRNTQNAGISDNQNTGITGTPTLRSSDVSDSLSRSESFRAPAPAPLPTKEELGKTVDLAREAQQLQMKIIQTERTLAQIKSEAQKPMPVPVDYSQQVNKILEDLKTLMDQASKVKTQIQSVQQPEAVNVPPPPAVKQKVTVVAPAKTKQTTVALTTFPNVINGIIKDKTGNSLEGVVAVIYDKEGLPVRALKTNKLGQFTGSTPLPNGTYNLELEKDAFTFDVLQMELTGAVMQPLLITAK
ncbi:PrgI family protein [Candidatus Daviesbacteria bacterium]|nr:PrgI family protein [Candidatus Daviesbacteria bacterium]